MNQKSLNSLEKPVLFTRNRFLVSDSIVELRFWHIFSDSSKVKILFFDLLDIGMCYQLMQSSSSSVQTTVRKLICARLWKVSKTKTTKIESCHNFLKISRKHSRTHFCQTFTTPEIKRVVDWPFTNKFRVSVVKNRLGLF